MTGKLASALAFGRAHGVQIGLEALANFVGPLVVYSLARPALGDADALIASSAPPILWSIVEFARKRRVDALSILVLAGIGLSLLAFMGGGGVRFLQLREKLVTGLIGLVFLGSAAIGRPLIYQLARASLRRRSASQAQALEGLRDNAEFRRAMTMMTLVWGTGLVAEAAVSGLLVFVISIRQFLIVGPVIGYGTAGLLVLWTMWFSRRLGRLAARRARGLGAAGPRGESDLDSVADQSIAQTGELGSADIRPPAQGMNGP